MDGQITGDMTESVLRVVDDVSYVTKTLTTREDNLIDNRAYEQMIEIWGKSWKRYIWWEKENSTV